jgi:hypothetical protein
MRRGRRRHVPPDLTSLFDVLFIVIFVALIRAAAAEHAIAAPAPAPAPVPVPPLLPPALDPRALHARAVAALDAELTARATVVVRISTTATAGTISGVETAGEIHPLDVPLLEQSSDPDVRLAYLGDRSIELHACRIAALHLGVADLSRYLVVFATDRALVDLPHALYAGLRRDVDRCLAEQHAIAAIVAPEPAATP